MNKLFTLAGLSEAFHEGKRFLVISETGVIENGQAGTKCEMFATAKDARVKYADVPHVTFNIRSLIGGYYQS